MPRPRYLDCTRGTDCTYICQRVYWSALVLPLPSGGLLRRQTRPPHSHLKLAELAIDTSPNLYSLASLPRPVFLPPSFAAIAVTHSTPVRKEVKGLSSVKGRFVKMYSISTELPVSADCLAQWLSCISNKSTTGVRQLLRLLDFGFPPRV